MKRIDLWLDRVLDWRLWAALGLVLCLSALMLHPAPGHHAVAAAFLLLPVVLFGLVAVPRSLWPPHDPGLCVALSPIGGPSLFQRPPPFSAN